MTLVTEFRLLNVHVEIECPCRNPLAPVSKLNAPAEIHWRRSNMNTRDPILMKSVEVLKDCRSLNAAAEMNCPMPRSVEKVPIRNEKRCSKHRKVNVCMVLFIVCKKQGCGAVTFLVGSGSGSGSGPGEVFRLLLRLRVKLFGGSGFRRGVIVTGIVVFARV